MVLTEADAGTGLIAGRAAPADGRALQRARAAVVTDFDTMFHENYERLVRSLTVIGDDRETAADAVQEAFVRAHLRWRTVRSYDDPIGWVRRVAINLLRDQHRRQVRRQRAMDRLGVRRQHPVEPELPDDFDRLLSALPTQQRATIALYYVDGLSVREIAEALSIAEGSVKSHLFDARRRLRRLLEDEFDRA